MAGQRSAHFIRGRPAWQPGSPWGWPVAVLAGLAILALAQLAGAAAYRLIWPGMPVDSVMLHLVLVSQVVMIGLTCLAASIRGHPVEALRLGRPAGGPVAYPLALAVLVAFVAVVNACAWLVSPEDLLRDFNLFRSIVRGAEPLIPALAICLGAPVAEELLFRGFLLPPLAASRLGYWPAAVVTSVLWTLMHAGYSWVGLTEIFVIGLCLSWLLRRTNSLRVPIFCHAFYNTALFLVMRYGPF
jgi:uncharacterized protein